LLTLKYTADVSANLGRPAQTIVDARSPARYKGETEPFDPVAGHIPGALNRPFNSNFNAQGFMKSPTELKAEFESLLNGRDASSVVHHCGSGISAVPNVLAMEVAGLGKTALYAGSWSEWCNTPGLPCAQG
jgi:thiosulfate/3-mercaptopyruvate sulfurtransferase